EPTNTDANLILGRLDTNLLDGQMKLNKEAARNSIQPICQTFGYTEEEAAHAILQVANANMSDAIRLISVRRGYDTRDFALVAMGGAGALNCAYVAQEMEIPNVVVPAQSGVAGALGCLLVDSIHDKSQTYVENIKKAKLEDKEKQIIEMEEEAAQLLKKESI